MPNFCQYCGYQNRAEARFCGGCGRPLAQSPTPDSTAEELAPPPAGPPALLPNEGWPVGPPVPLELPAGWPLPVQTPLAPAPGPAPAQVDVTPGIAPVGIGLFDFADFGQRLVAYLLDVLILDGVVVILAIMAVSTGGAAATNTGPTAWVISLAALASSLGALGFSIWYQVFLPSQAGQTWGKRAVGIKIVDANGDPLTAGKAALRHLLGYPISGALLYLGFLWALWDEDRQALHDKLAGTYVVRA